MKKVLVLVAAAGLAGAASADFNTGIQAGPFASNGPVGDASNGTYTFTYSGVSAATYNSIRLRGTATSTGAGSWVSELRYRFIGATNLDSGSMSAVHTWSGGLAIDNTQSYSSFSMTNGNSYSFKLWESFDDGGTGTVDANWSNLQFDFGGPPPPPASVFAGTYNAGLFDINTFTSSYDTEIGLYSSAGALIANNDDTSPGLQSQITPTLANGTYYLAVGGYDTTFGAVWSVSGGAANGNMNLSINGGGQSGNHTVDNRTTLAGEVAWYRFDVIPTPGSLGLLGLGGLVAIRRRR